MSPEERNIKEIKLTAAVYATVDEILKHVKATGRLPVETKPRPWLIIALNHIIRERRRDISLTPDEQLVFDAILKEKRLPGGGAILVPQDDE